MALKEIFDAIVTLEGDNIEELVRKEISGGTDVQAILNDALIAAMDEVGRQFGEGEMFLPEMLMAAQTMKAGLEVLRPHLAEGATESKGTIVIGTVKGDLHDIGKNLVAMMLEGAGFNVVDLGVDVPPEKFIAAAREHGAGAVAMSALLSTTMPCMQETVAAIKEAGLPLKTMVGGAPVTPSFAEKIGADGYSDDAPRAVELARRLLGV